MSAEMESEGYPNIYLMLIKTFHSLFDLLYIPCRVVGHIH